MWACVLGTKGVDARRESGRSVTVDFVWVHVCSTFGMLPFGQWLI